MGWFDEQMKKTNSPRLRQGEQRESMMKEVCGNGLV